MKKINWYSGINKQWSQPEYSENGQSSKVQSKRYAASCWDQLKVLLKRAFICIRRDKVSMRLRRDYFSCKLGSLLKIPCFYNWPCYQNLLLHKTWTDFLIISIFIIQDAFISIKILPTGICKITTKISIHQMILPQNKYSYSGKYSYNSSISITTMYWKMRYKILDCI